MDVNGILHVEASDKSTGKSEKIKITSEDHGLSQEEIDRMVREGEEFAEEDRKVKERVPGTSWRHTFTTSRAPSTASWETRSTWTARTRWKRR